MNLAEIERIFNGALELEGGEARSAFIRRESAGDDALRRKVERLLAVHEDVPHFLAADSAGPEIATSTEGPGDMVGRYKLIEKLGEGGFGVVWIAEQQEPVRRRVAVKIIKLGMDTRQFVARFEAERQALALMDHPNIAKVLDAGAMCSGGRPYFVMELVRGIPITRFCEEKNLSMDDRLKLFCDVCAAIQHAHQKGVIHRDIKPTNVLVSMIGEQPLPKP